MHRFNRPSVLTFGVLGLLLLAILLVSPHSHTEWLLIVGLSGALGLLTALHAHELGHLLAGTLMGFRAALFIVGPFQFEGQAEGGLQVRWNENWAYYGGLAVAYPRNIQHLRLRQAVYTAGGPLVSLLVAVLAFVAQNTSGLNEVNRATYTMGEHSASALAFSTFIFFLGLTSGGLGLATLIPAMTSSFMTDGARLWALLRGSQKAEQLSASNTLNAMLLGGKRPGELDVALVARALQLPSHDNGLPGMHYLAYIWALDLNEIKRAGHYLDLMVSHYDRVNTALKPTFALEAAYFEAFYRHNLTVAQMWLAKVNEGPFVYTAHVRRAQAAVQLEEGQPEEAIHTAQAGLEAVKQIFGDGSVQAEREKLEALIAVARGEADAPCAPYDR
ncbi:MAG: hypothetical protein OHK0046_21060 [Anaerolineae bacterium]